MAGGVGAASFVVAPESTAGFTVGTPSVTTFAAGVTGRPLWPSDITGLVLWLPADQIQGIASGTSLSNWTDSSASASHATQPSGVSQPVYVTNVQAGLSAVSFGAGVAQLLTSPTSILDSATIAVAAAPSVATTTTRRMIGSPSGLFRMASVSGNYVAFQSGTVVGGVVVKDQWVSWLAIASGSTITLSINGLLFSNVSTGVGVGPGTTTNIAATNPSLQTFSCYIGEAMIWNRPLNEVERSSLDSYLRTKWVI